MRLAELPCTNGSFEPRTSPNDARVVVTVFVQTRPDLRCSSLESGLEKRYEKLDLYVDTFGIEFRRCSQRHSWDGGAERQAQTGWGYT